MSIEKLPKNELSQKKMAAEKKVGRYNVLTPKEVEEISATVERFTRELHDFNPDYVFLDDTSAVPLGFALKEAWESAYPDHKSPPFYRIDPRSLLLSSHDLGFDHSEKIKELAAKIGRQDQSDKYLARLEDFLKQRIKKQHPRIAIVDECSPSGASPGAVEEVLREYLESEDSRRAEIHIVSQGDGPDGLVCGAYSGFTKKDTGPKFINEILGGEKSLEDVKFSGEIISSREGWRHPREGEAVAESDKVKLKRYSIDKVRMNLFDYLADLKQIGRETGKMLKTETQTIPVSSGSDNQRPI